MEDIKSNVAAFEQLIIAAKEVELSSRKYNLKWNIAYKYMLPIDGCDIRFYLFWAVLHINTFEKYKEYIYDRTKNSTIKLRFLRKKLKLNTSNEKTLGDISGTPN